MKLNDVLTFRDCLTGQTIRVSRKKLGKRYGGIGGASIPHHWQLIRGRMPENWRII